MATADLPVPPGPGNPEGLIIPCTELTERFSRSSGPGGQSVNTTDTRVELVFTPGASAAFTPPQRSRVLQALGCEDDAEVRVVASTRASQWRNRAEARTRLAALIREALMPPSPARRPTRPSRRARQRRLDDKRRRGQVKSLRKRPGSS